MGGHVSLQRVPEQINPGFNEQHPTILTFFENSLSKKDTYAAGLADAGEHGALDVAVS